MLWRFYISDLENYNVKDSRKQAWRKLLIDQRISWTMAGIISNQYLEGLSQ